MLGENHSLVSEFPDKLERIKQLSESDAAFRDKMQAYDSLDKEIRELELKNSPVDDAVMHEKKHDRAVLKDQLFQLLQA